jgi:GNAT superfamily N-acetyltransferase
MPPFRIRPAHASDADAAAALMCASIATLCAADHGGDAAAIERWCANKTPRTVAGWIANPQTLFLVAENTALLGVAAADRACAEILLNYVAPEARFRGASSALLATLEHALSAHGHREAHLESTRTAHRFYRARGWSDAGPPTSTFGSAGQPMAKRLAALPGAPSLPNDYGL